MVSSASMVLLVSISLILKLFSCTLPLRPLQGAGQVLAGKGLGQHGQVAARLARAMDAWARLAEPYRSAAREAIARVAARPDLSNDVREVVTRALAGQAPALAADAEARTTETPDTQQKGSA